MKSELIKLNEIKITIPKTTDIYNQFYLYDENDNKTNLKIINQERLTDCTIYYLMVENLEIGKNYQVGNNQNNRTSLLYTEVVHTKEFDNLFFYDQDDLGPSYSKEKTTFKIWAPTSSAVYLDLTHNSKKQIYAMKRKEKGVFEISILGDLELAEYIYLVKHENHFLEAIDPYAYSSTPNSKKSVVINLNKCNVELNEYKLPKFSQNVDAIIYELHVRDFSISDCANFKHRGKYLAFLEENVQTKKGTPVGINYLKSLGFTHLQLQPIYDFGSVDELHQTDFYNWGYDPVQYGIPEGSYVEDIYNPYARILECKKMIAKIHEYGLFVNMDVVYNHMFSIDISTFSKLVPFYYFRYNEDGTPSNGSFCQNDMDSTKLMYQKYMLDMCKRWISFYGVDGFRFDLMGIHDVETMNKVYALAISLKPHFMVYGEGWNMPTNLDEKDKAIQLNNDKMPFIAHFNDRFRDTVKGKTADDALIEKGFATGTKESTIPHLMKGTVEKENQEYAYLSPNQVINYVECHDNATVWDKMLISNKSESVDIRKKEQN